MTRQHGSVFSSKFDRVTTVTLRVTWCLQIIVTWDTLSHTSCMYVSAYSNAAVLIDFMSMSELPDCLCIACLNIRKGLFLQIYFDKVCFPYSMIKKVVSFARDKSSPPRLAFANCIVNNRSVHLCTGPMDTTGQFILIKNFSHWPAIFSLGYPSAGS